MKKPDFIKHAHFKHSKGHFIDGIWMPGKGEAFYSQNPANGFSVWQGHQATAEEVNLAFAAASSVASHWASISWEERCHYLQRFAQIVKDRSESLTYLISLESGKPLWESLTEVNSVISKIDISIQAYRQRNQEEITPKDNVNACLRYKPHGVVAILGPFNFPAHLSNGHIVPALLAGNSIIYKPSELTPAVAESIMDCWEATGIPTGVINCVQGDRKTALALLNTPIKGVYFTGSYRTGKSIHQHFSGRPDIILALEMGGNNPLVIEDVHNLSAALYNTLLSAFITAGQRCTCARRLLIPNNAFGDHFLSQLIKSCKKLVIGAFDAQPEPFMGPVIRYEHALHHLQSQEQLITGGGQALLKMQLLKDKSGLLSPGIIDMTGINSSSDEEIFAPCLQLYRYDNFEEAVSLANQTQYGLAAGLFSDNQSHYEFFYQHVNAGLINWNRSTTGALSTLPFGGIGHSGNHRPSAYFATDYCAYPIASLEEQQLSAPKDPLPGIVLDCL